MTFEYRDSYGRVLTVAHGLDDDGNSMAVLWARGEYGVSVPVRIPANRVEEVIAGIRDAARTAAARQTTGQDDTDRYDARLTASMTAEAATALRDRIETDTVARRAVGQSAEAQATDEARPPREEWRIELLDVDGWMPSGLVRPDRELAAQYLAGRRKQRPDATFRLVRETTTWTVEDER